MLIRNSLDPRTVANTGRWADVSLLMNTYAHSEDADRKVIDAIRTGRVQAEARNLDKSLKLKRNK